MSKDVNEVVKIIKDCKMVIPEGFPINTEQRERNESIDLYNRAVDDVIKKVKGVFKNG